MSQIIKTKPCAEAVSAIYQSGSGSIKSFPAGFPK